jgi:uncharacterized YccA/Bax inhibitor family protein
MESRNPVLRNYDERYGSQGVPAGVDPAMYTPEQLQQMFERPSFTGDRVTLDDVVVKTGINFAILLVGAVVGWQLVADFPFLVWSAALVGFGLAMVNIFKKQVSPALVLAYAAVEGVFLGGISRWYDVNFSSGDGSLVLQAVTGTLVAFGVMLTLYATGVIKVGNRFRKVMMVALVSYAVIAVASLISSFFGVGGGWGFYGVDGIGLLLCAGAVLLASLTLALDFDSISQSIAAGVPERESWRLAFGLLVTLIWLYLEILRFLAILNSSD